MSIQCILEKTGLAHQFVRTNDTPVGLAQLLLFLGICEGEQIRIECSQPNREVAVEQCYTKKKR